MRIAFLTCLCCLSIWGRSQNQNPVPYTYAQLYQFLEDAKDNQDVWRLAEVYAQLGDYHLNAIDYENAFKSYKKSIEYYSYLGDSTKLYGVKIALAQYYQQLDYFDDAINHYQEAIRFYKKEKAWPLLARTYLNLSSIYRKSGDYEAELSYLNKGADINRVVKDTLLEITYHIDRSNSYQKLERYDEAMNSAQRALKLSYFIGHQDYLGL
ncbi:MAG: tetratricopeptide repeat protein, partial [Bacteroidota bacterium]